MKTLYDLCTPRQSVIDGTDKDDVLDLSDLSTNKIDSKKFFEETYMTDGLLTLFKTAFDRFKGKSDRSVIRLTQNMGGGKSHCMIALGLLAKNPVLRYQLFGHEYEDVPNEINVVSYTGRNSDIKYGIWGEIARQLGKESDFNQFYSPLMAPGQNSWINLLQNEKPTLILLDELPPYLEDAMSKTIGTSTLATVTVTALSNLLTAVSKKELDNVLVVISDLKSNYEEGNTMLSSAFRNLEDEIGRYALNIEPVNRSNNDLYNILKKKCFVSYPKNEDADVIEIAQCFKNELEKAKQTGITSASSDSLYQGVVETYPFHPCLKDLFGRFKENQNFQQTRGFIRLARNMIRCLWKDGECKNKYIINAYDIDLRDNETYSTIKGIKPQLDNAISHDIVSQEGSLAMAEECDANTNSHRTEDLCKMILVSSLANVINSVLGLTESDLAAYMVGPNYEINNIRNLLEQYKGKAWYLYFDKNNKVFYKETKNVNAELASRKNGYTQENAKQYIQKLLTERFEPKIKDVYQKVQVFPGLDQIELSKDKITLILFEPNTDGTGLQPQLLEWYNAQKYKNRVCFLSGQRNGMQSLLENAKENLAINAILDIFINEEHVSENDAQLKAAKQLQDRIILNLCSSLKEIFVTLYYPTKSGLKPYQINMQFGANKFDYEEQIRDLLANVVRKFTTIDTNDAKSDESFRKRIEDRIFTADKMLWNDIEERAATETGWIWYLPTTLREAKNRYIQRGFWSEDGNMVNKFPPKLLTSVSIKEIYRENGEVSLKIIPINGDKVFYEVGQLATTASLEIKPTDLSNFKTSELKLSFLCVDTKGNNETGEPTSWVNISNCKYKTYDMSGDKMCELQADSNNVEIRYTVDGSNPMSDSAATYLEPFALPSGKVILQAITYSKKYDIWGNLLTETIQENDKTEIIIDKTKTLILNQLYLNMTSTKDTFNLLSSLNNYDAEILGFNITIMVNEENFEFSSSDKFVSIKTINQVLDVLTGLYTEGQVLTATMIVDTIKFETGEKFLAWIAEKKKEVSDFAKNIKQ